MNSNKKSPLYIMGERLINGIFKENPTFVLLLGMCPTLAVTTSAMNGLGMGLTTMVVLAMSNMIISALRKVIPDKIRIPAFIVIIASFVTIVELLLKGYLPSLYDSLGIYIPLIVVNCIILGRAEAFAYSNGVLASLFDGIGMGLGFSVALTLIGAFRELLGSGYVFGLRVMPVNYVPVSILVMAPGAFFVLAILTAVQNFIKDVGTRKGKDMSKIQSGCGGNCLECNKECADRTVEDSSKVTKEVNAPQNTVQINDEPEKEKAAKESFIKDKPVNEKSVKEMLVEKELVNEETDKEISITEIPVTEESVTQEPVKKNSTKTNGKKTKKKIDIPAEKETEESEAAKKENISDDPSEEKKITEVLPEPEKVSYDKSEEKSNASDDSDELEFIDLKETARARVEAKPKRPTRKKANMDKARLMLSKAEEKLKEDENND